MAFGIDDAVAGVSNLLSNAINKIWPDPLDKAKAEAVAITAAADAAIATLKAQLSVMLAEAQSSDPWTSRARPSFLYVMYVMILAAIPMGICAAISPHTAAAIISGMKDWLAAIPDNLYSLFATVALGYVVARSADKAGGLVPLVTGKK